jgi:hypothetical protein
VEFYFNIRIPLFWFYKIKLIITNLYYGLR